MNKINKPKASPNKQQMNPNTCFNRLNSLSLGILMKFFR